MTILVIICSIIGSLALLLAYFRVNYLNITDYYWLNLIGSMGFLVSCLIYWNPFTFLFNVMWLCIGVYKLIKEHRK